MDDEDWQTATGRMIETPLAGGRLSHVIRRGNTVRRPKGPWTPAVHMLLRHLEQAGFDRAPRVLGTDDAGREVLTFIEGVSGARPWPAKLRTDEGLRELVLLLRNYHAAVAGFIPPDDAVWAAGTVFMHPGELVRHGDFGPWNTIWRGGRPVALIDFDLVEPGDPLFDLAQAALFALPLQGPLGIELAGFESPPNLYGRLLVLCETYGRYGPDEVLAGVRKYVTWEIDRVQRLGEQGRKPWVKLLANGKVAEFRQYEKCLPENVEALRSQVIFSVQRSTP